MPQTDVELDARCAKALRRDLIVLIRFVETYCHGRHRGMPLEPPPDKPCNVAELARHQVKLCSDCAKLLTHALVKRTTCPMNPKPMCKRCPAHCYHPKYRGQIREVMKYSGRKLVLRGRLDYLIHLFF